MHCVSVAKCSSYEDVVIGQAIDRLLHSLGGIEKYINKGEKVVIKPNFVSKKHPNSAATTHPSVILAVVRAVQRAGGVAIIAESSGGTYSQALLKRLYAVCGAEKVAAETGCELNYDVSWKDIEFDGIKKRRFSIISPVLSADKVISISKLKTHTMTSYTGAVKNLFGTIPGLYKAQYHFEFAEKEDFSSLLVDLCRCVKPCLSIMDAVIAMEGNGPTSGTPKAVGAILASENPFSLDVAAIHMIDMEPSEVHTVNQSIDLGLARPFDELTLIGDNIEEVYTPDFKRADGADISFLRHVPLPNFVRNLINSLARAKPIFDEKLCVGCRECEKCCPPHAIVMKEKLPIVEMKKCIRCFCCQELCPQKAVSAKRNIFFEKLFRK